MKLKDLVVEENWRNKSLSKLFNKKFCLGSQGSNQALLEEVISHYMLQYSHLNFLELKH